MLSSLSSNTGHNAASQIEKAKLDDIYCCINDLEERINDNCACGQHLQEQIDCINDNPVIIKDEGQFDNIYTDCLNVTNPIVAPGVDNDFVVAGNLTANEISVQRIDVNDNLTVDGNTMLNGPTWFNCVPHACINDLNVTTVDASAINTSSLCSDNIDVGNIDAQSLDAARADISTADINTAAICDASINDLNVATINTPSATICGATICCGNITGADINILKNSKQIGNQFISVPVDALGETADFYRYQIYPGFSGEVNLWNCDFSINILTNNSNNVLVSYRADDPSKIRSFYKDNVNCKFYIETTSTENICWSYRTAEQKCYNFSENFLIEACTTAGAVYVPDCVYVDIEHSNNKDHYYLLGDNTTQSGLSICGTLAATYIAFEQAYFPDLTVDNLTVNDSACFKGVMSIGSENCPANICQYGNHDLDNIHVRCCSFLGDTLTPTTTYTLSTFWEDRDYYTYDGSTYTYVGRINEEDWEANTYYIRHDYSMSCNILCGCNMLIGGATVTCGQLCTDCLSVACDLFVTGCTNTNRLEVNCCATISGSTYFDGGSDNCPIVINTDIASNCSIDAGGCLSVGCNLSVTGCTNINQLAVNCCATFACDVSINGDLFVDGTMHIVDEETINVNGDIITLRTNNSTSLAGDQVSGLFINKYNGTDDLTVAADCTGTLRVGTASGPTNFFDYICYNSSTNEWMSGGIVVNPIGELTSWSCKEEIDPFTHYTNAYFTQIDVTTMEPVATRAESASMNDNSLAVWNAACERFETISAPANDGEMLCACINGGNLSYCWTTCVAKMETMTEVAYQALAVKDPDTYYFTTGTGGGVYKGTDRIATNDVSCNFTVQNCLQACDTCVACIHATQQMVIPTTPPATTTVGAMWLTV